MTQQRPNLEDLETIHHRYAAERDKRIREDGNDQYVEIAGDLARYVDDLEAELAAAEAEKRKLETERDILRQAAKYFAGETNW